MTSQLDNPKTWATGADAPTEKQTTFLQTLAKEKGVEVDANNLNKGEASAKINELKNKETANPDATAGEPIQDPKGWATGDDPATGKQTGYIAVMAKEAGEDVKTEGMGKAEASEKIGELKGKTGM
jgi:hypothetical protein